MSNVGKDTGNDNISKGGKENVSCSKNVVNTSNKYVLLLNEFDIVFEENKPTGKETGTSKVQEDVDAGDDSKGEVEKVDNETGKFLASESGSGFWTKSLYE